MRHKRIKNNLRRLNKKKLILALVISGLVLLLILLVVGAIVIAVINTLLGQTDGISKSISDLIPSLWNTAIDFIGTLWNQIVANPLQFLTGGNN